MLELKGYLFVVSGPSGSGKTTLVNKLINDLSSKFSIERVITYTSRFPRVGEIHGIDYNFINKEEFEEKIKNNFFIEHSYAYGSYYGSPRYILSKVQEGISFVIILDQDGASNIKASYPEAILIWITTNNIEELNKRLEYRGTETQEQVEYRLNLAKKEMTCSKIDHVFDYQLINNEIESSFKLLKDFLLSKMRFDQ